VSSAQPRAIEAVGELALDSSREPSMTEFVMIMLVVLPLDTLPPTPSPSGPPAHMPGRGAYILGGFFGLGIIVLAMVLLRFPKRANRPPRDQ
jgi:hypothetical protein